jgi:hypothetical protein
MTTWILLVMLCNRSCVPQYAIQFPDKASCEARLEKPSVWGRETTFCVPIVKEKNT